MPGIQPVVVMTAVADELAYISRKMGGAEIGSRTMLMSRLYGSDQQEKGNYPCSVVGPFIGAPYAVILLETLIAWGAETILFIGLCGSISPDIRIGDVIVPSSAVIDEGTTRHYSDDDTYPATDPRRVVMPSEKPIETITKTLVNASVAFHQGPIWTTDALFRETRAKVAYHQQHGVLCVDMETSALFSVAEFYGVKAAAVHVVSDELFTGEWNPGFKNKKLKQVRRTVCDCVMDICRKL